ncbi:MAG TPA: hypothetical protein VK966_05850, partial [Longimicrobiales bacterium]|nr:hypothetical protein [Longimicrobiales bacterium]
MKTRCMSRANPRPGRWFALAVGVAVALFTAADVDAQQQAGIVAGQVVSSETGQPLSGVQITVAGTNL